MAAPVAHVAAGDVTTATDPSNGNITCSKPANVASGDVLVAVVYSTVGGGTWDTVPAGWTQGALANSSRTLGVFTKPIPSAASETATDYTWHNSGGAGRIGALIFRATGVSGDQPIDAVGAPVASGTSTIVDPAVTAVSSEALLIGAFVSNIASGTPTAVTKPASMTNVGGWNVSSGTNASTGLICFETLSATGSTGTRTATVSPSGANAFGLMITLNPGTVAAPPDPPVAHASTGDVSSVTVSSSPTLRVPKPPNVADNDLLIGVLLHRNSGPAFTTLPPGWKPWPVAYTANGVLAAYWRYVDNAATEPDAYTWRSPNGSARGAVAMFRVTGAAPPDASGGPVDSYGATVGSGTSSIVAPAATVGAPAALLIGCFGTTSSSTTPATVTAPSGMTEAAGVPVVTGTAAAYLEVATQQLTVSGSSGAKTATVSPDAGSAAGFLLAVAPPGYGTAEPAELLGRLTGGVTQTTVKVAAVTRFCSSVRFARSTSPDLSSPTYSSAATPDRDGIATATLSSLSADTQYFWGVELDGTLDTAHVSSFRTLPTAGTATSFSFAAASCGDTNSNADSFADAASRTGPTGRPARFIAHLGDMHYQDIGLDDDAWVLGAWLNVLSQSNQQALYASAPLAYTWSDHDFSGPNTDASGAAAPAVQAVYRRLFPSYALPGDGAGIYQSWQIGRVLFVMTDGRSYMDPITKTDDSSKTKLGATQKAWLKTQLVTAGVGLVVWLHEDAWHNRTTFPGDDTWSAYSAERQELADYITAHNVPLLYVHGDVHALSHDDGSHVPGGFPLVSASPWDQTTFIGNGLLTSGFVPDPVSASVKSQQYGWFDVLDDGTQIVVRFLGIASGSVALRAEMSWGIRRHIGWGVPL